MKTYKYEVISARHGNVLGYVRAADLTHAWVQAASRYRVPIVVLGEYGTRSVPGTEERQRTRV